MGDNFQYDAADPAAIKTPLSLLSKHDPAVYQILCNERVEAGKLSEWGHDLTNLAISSTSKLMSDGITDKAALKEAQATQQQLQRYVSNILPQYQGQHNRIHQCLQAAQQYAMYGLSINGFILGASSACPSTSKDALFFGPERQFTSFLQDLIWTPRHIQQYLVAFVL